jgi:hypothetical protein
MVFTLNRRHTKEYLVFSLGSTHLSMPTAAALFAPPSPFLLLMRAPAR